MKIEILRLVSVGPNTAGAYGAQSVGLIYSYLLQKYDQYVYNHIQINHINDDELQEFVMKNPGNRIHVNIRYPVRGDFESKSADEKNIIRLDVIHTALLRIAEFDKKIDSSILKLIRTEILKKDFNFEIEYKSFRNKKNNMLIGRVIVHPLIDKFVLYGVIEENGQ